LFSVPDKRWFRAEDHVGTLRDFMSSVASMDFCEEIHCLDLFGASGRIAGTFVQAGYKALGFDIKINPLHDITQESGLKELIRVGMQLLDIELFPNVAQ